MTLKVTSEAKYHLIQCQDKHINGEECKAIVEEVNKLQKEKPGNIIIDLTPAKNASHPNLKLLENLNFRIVKKKLSMVVAANEEDITSFLNQHFISNAPTVSEAIDLLYMEELEKDLLDEDFENDDDFGS